MAQSTSKGLAYSCKFKLGDEHTRLMAEDDERSGLESRIPFHSDHKILGEMYTENIGEAMHHPRRENYKGLQCEHVASVSRNQLSKNIRYRLGATSKLRSIAFITCSLRCWTALSVSTPAQASAKRRHPLNCTSQWLHLGDIGRQKLTRCFTRTLRILKAKFITHLNYQYNQQNYDKV